MGTYRNADEVMAELAALHPTLDFSSSVYKGSTRPLTVICPKHGEITKPWASHWRFAGCKRCGYEKAHQDADSAKLRAAGFLAASKLKLEKGRQRWANWLSVNKDTFSADPAEYVGVQALTNVTCLKHGYTWQTRPKMLMEQGSGCIYCGKEKMSATNIQGHARNVAKARKVHGDRYEYPHEITHSHMHTTIVCKEHGPFVQDFHNHLSGSGCPKCVSTISSDEQEVADYLRELGAECEQQNRTVLAPAEIDIWIPAKNLAIEFNGSHWHADDRARRNTSLSKFKACQEKGIRLISIFDFEWQNSNAAVRATLRAAMGKQERIGARSVVLDEISAATARAFLDVWHVDRFASAKLYIGLYKTGKLLGVASFGKARFEEGAWELVRFATAVHIIGGLSKCVKYAQQALNFQTLVSYCDMRYGTGKSYASAGFVLDGMTPPDYWWFKSKLRLKRYQTQKHKLKDHPLFAEHYSDDKTEVQICEEAGFRKLTGVGHTKWIRKFGVQTDGNLLTAENFTV